MSDAGYTNFYTFGLDLSGTLQGAGGVGGLLAATLGGTTSVSSVFYAYDGNGNVMALVDASNGTVAAEYEYDPFGNTIRSTGDAADDNPVRWSTKHTDPETELVMYEYRPYDPELGRWLQRDPLGEQGGVNLYACLGNSLVNQQDILGLGTYKQLSLPAGQNLEYSCLCGWIDWSHATGDEALHVKKYLDESLAYSGPISGDPPVVVGSAKYSRKYLAGLIEVSGTASYQVNLKLSPDQYNTVAMSIFRVMMERYEAAQAFADPVKHSSFAQEDLVSNLIGFYRIFKGFSFPKLREICGALGAEKSDKVWKANREVDDHLGKVDVESAWQPVLEEKTCGFCDGDTSFPAELSTIQPAGEDDDYIKVW